MIKGLTGSSLGHGREWIFSLIEPNMAGDVNAARDRFNALISTLRQRIANKKTWQRAILEFVWGIRSKPWETEAAEGAELLIVWWCLKKFLER